MKKIILAPAVALAFTGLIASPVAAAESPAPQSAASKSAEQKQAEAEKAKKEEAKKKAEKEAAAKKAEAEKKAEEKAAAEKKAAADKKAKDAKAAAKKKADEKKAAEDKADKKGDAKPPKKVDPKPAPAPKDEDKDAKDDDKSEDKVNPINASVQVVSGDVTAEELHEDGVTVKVTGLEKGDKVSAKSGLTGPSATAQGSTATLKLRSAKELSQDSVSFAVQVQRADTQSVTKTSSINVLADDAVDPIDASLKVDPKEITAEDLANKDKGVDVTVTGIEEGDEIKDSLTGKTETAEADGSHKLHLWYEGNPDSLEEGKVPFTVTIDREGESETLNGNINVVDEVTEADPKVSLNTDKISQSDFNKNGIKVTGEGFTPGGKVTVVGGGAQSAFATEEVTADDEGKVSATLKFEGEGDLPAGDYSVWGVDQESDTNSDPQTFTLTEDDAVDPIDASLKVDPKEITAEDLANKDKGVTVTVTGVKKGDKIKDSLTGKTETADADGDYKLHLWYEGNPDSLEEGKVPFTVTIDREGTESETLNGNINIVAEDGDDGDGDNPEAPAEATLKVSPKKIEAADFANEKKGVTLAVENCEPGQDVHFEVNPKGINVTAYENTVKADDEGRASVNVFGTSSDASAYVGAYTATATCGDDTMKDSFTVTEGANGGGSDGGDNGNAGNGSGDDGSQLPRTGADLGGLTTGAMLLLVGGAAIALTGRKNKFGQTPTSF
ncbi:hypothetical protein [Brevibacterium spongiae]|uniref:LPXTG cell wall anchor domain-containing protein n=1 Tax=Brevibacterium spongiae TaxID=2909672 RepID=A0ABY5SMY8_9MICO|nr:hypothetical protein [Brevibacterium spongiae]UVI35665.1 hypothetical protein L1F31_16345 [Brevibacterium spongiae]